MIGAKTRYGIEKAAATMEHEKQHIRNYQQRQNTGETDTDMDGLADSEEGKSPYFFICDVNDPFTRDTYSLEEAISSIYRSYGDDEFVSRMAEPRGAAAAKLNEDWSKGGAQWRR
jgi:hypothetical protein